MARIIIKRKITTYYIEEYGETGQTPYTLTFTNFRNNKRSKSNLKLLNFLEDNCFLMCLKKEKISEEEEIVESYAPNSNNVKYKVLEDYLKHAKCQNRFQMCAAVKEHFLKAIKDKELTYPNISNAIGIVKRELMEIYEDLYRFR